MTSQSALRASKGGDGAPALHLEEENQTVGQEGLWGGGGRISVQGDM